MEKTSKNRNISVVIPSRATPLPLKNLLTCLKNQTFQDFEILIVCDRSFTTSKRDLFQQEIYQDRKSEKKDQKIRIFSHLNSDFNKDHEGGASYIRNFGIKNAKGSYIQLFDDDNEIDPQYLEHTLKLHQTYTQRYQKEVIITPTLMWRNTDKIQNQGFSDYNYRLARPMIHFLKPGQAY